jgi:U3 small nucleolar RNA-associated protein 19
MSGPASKKRRLIAPAESIHDLESTLTAALKSNGSLNPLADLVDMTLKTTSASDTHKAIYALYRVFVLIISGGRLSTSESVVKAWLWQRLNAYVDFLVGLLQDEEKQLRKEALKILMELLKCLSSTAPPPWFHIQHFRKILKGLLVCPKSTRDAVGEEEVEEALLRADVLDEFYETWFSVYDDVRWFFLREAGTILSTIDASQIPINLLSVLEKLNTFPTEQAELNAWWVQELGAKPKPAKKRKRKQGEPDAEDDMDEDEPIDEDASANPDDDWRKFFDDSSKDKDKSKEKTATSVRPHLLTLHQSLHSLPSHRAVFTRTWLLLLPRLSHSTSLSVRALNVMHRGVLPHLTRPLLVMDWIGGAVDRGGIEGILALNTLFILMRDYNL